VSGEEEEEEEEEEEGGRGAVLGALRTLKIYNFISVSNLHPKTIPPHSPRDAEDKKKLAEAESRIKSLQGEVVLLKNEVSSVCQAISPFISPAAKLINRLRRCCRWQRCWVS
jgi:hypothetical protein